MSETTPTSSELNALSGTTGSRGMYYPAKGTGLDYYAELARNWDVIEKMIFAAAGLRVYQDGDATFGVYPGKYQSGDTTVIYSGSTANALTLSATNYIYLTATGTLTVNTTGFPNPSATPHIPLAVITVGVADYELDDIVDHRDRAALQILSAMTGATANTASVFFAALTATASEINTACDGVTATAAQINTAAALTGAITATASEINATCDGFTGSSANLNEASTFFGATDITGAEAETLTGGNDADSLHIHQGTIRKLATVTGVNLNVTTKTTLYTVPTGKTAIITDVIVRSASTSLTTASFGIGFNANGDDVVTAATHTNLTGSTLYEKLTIKAGAVIGNAADVLGLKCGTAQGAAATVTVTVFGYLI